MKPLRWAQENSLSLGIILCLGSFVLSENRLAMMLALAVGVVFLALSMVSAISGPSHGR